MINLLFVIVLLVAACLFVYRRFRGYFMVGEWVGRRPPVVSGKLPFIQAGLDLLSVRLLSLVFLFDYFSPLPIFSRKISYSNNPV
jgi:hypothetical protein